jgi:hypothetical protein
VKFQASAFDPDGSITQVQFFLETNFLGTATNPPFNVVAEMPEPVFGHNNRYFLKAVAYDNQGGSSESAPVEVGYPSLGPIFVWGGMVSPRRGAFFRAPASFDIIVQLLSVSDADGGELEFFIGGHSMGMVNGNFGPTCPATSMSVTNLPEGEYPLEVVYHADGIFFYRQTNTVRVFRLELEMPRVGPDGKLQFEVQTSLVGRNTVIQSSSNLLSWTSVSTNQPSTNIFTFTEPFPATNGPRFYRVIVPSL